VDCQDSHGNLIDGRFRRQQLFHVGLYDNFLADLPTKEKEDLKRIVFFQNSFFLSGREIPGLTGEIPKEGIVLSDGSNTNGDRCTIKMMKKFTSPKEFSTPWNPAVGPSIQASFDGRCANCTRAFAENGHLFQHW
jgi:hypothetical protein